MKVELEIPKLLYQSLEQYKETNDFETIEKCIYEIVSDTLYVGRYGDINNKIIPNNTEVKDMTPKKMEDKTTASVIEETGYKEKRESVKKEEIQPENKTENKVKTRKRTLKAK